MNALIAQRECPWHEMWANPGFLGLFPCELLAWLPLENLLTWLGVMAICMHRDRRSGSGPFPRFWSTARFRSTGHHTLSSHFYCTFLSLQPLLKLSSAKCMKRELGKAFCCGYKSTVHSIMKEIDKYNVIVAVFLNFFSLSPPWGTF